MDRRNFIMQDFTNPSNCGLEDCVCEEAVATNHRLEKIKPHALLMTTLFAFACAFVFSLVKMNIANASVFSNRQSIAIACSTNTSPQKEKQAGFNSDHQSNNNNNKGNCPHQLGSSCLLCSNDGKRKKSNMLIT